MFLRNYWYAAAWDEEVTRQPIHRTLLNEGIVLFRKEDRTPVALEDRCAHRRLPLSMGRVNGDTIQCRYHGLVFNASGVCITVPGQARVPSGARVRAYPVVEQHRLVYVWMGDPELADESKILSFPGLSDPRWVTTTRRFHVKANYLLLIDNLLDLSHLAYLHDTTIGNEPVAEEAGVIAERQGDGVRVTREMLNVPPAPWYVQFAKYSGNCDRWHVSDFRPPAYFVINHGSCLTGSGKSGDERLEGQGSWGYQVYHAITPETERTTQWFWSFAHDLAAVPAGEREEFYGQCFRVVGEDHAVYEAQQLSLDTGLRGTSADDVKSRVVIKADKALLLARESIKSLFEKEAAATRATANGSSGGPAEVTTGSAVP